MEATIVHYRLSAQDIEQISRRRTSSASIKDRIDVGQWPIGAQAHIGNPPQEGQYVPMLVTAFWRDEYGAGVHGVNGQAFLDGNDVLWVCSKREGEGNGEWCWPPRAA